MRQGPLAGRYPAVATMVMAALIPYLALSAAVGPVTPIIARDLHASPQTMSLGGGLANAAYAVGTVLAVAFAQHLPQRRMMLGYVVLLVIGSVLAAAAQNIVVHFAGQILQGLCTSMLLIAAVPPLSLGFPANKLKITGMIMNMCIFGAVALGPTIGGLQAEADAWRPLFWIISVIALTALVLVVLTFEDAPAADPDSPRDLPALVLALVGCFAAFFGASQLTSHDFLDPIVIVPLLGGLLTIIALVVYQYRAKNPLLTIREMLSSTIPIAGIIVALSAAAASVAATVLTASVLAEEYSPLHVGLLYLPEAAGAVITAVVLGMVLDTLFLHYLPLIGMGFLAAGIAVFLIQVPPSQPQTLVATFLTGVGLGATVAPALFVAGFSLRALNLQRVFAIVELFRAVAAFMIAPIFVYFAATVSDDLATGVRDALWIGLALALGGAALAVATYALGGARAQTPDIDGFIAGKKAAWYSPPLLARVRRTALPPQAVTEGGTDVAPDAPPRQAPRHSAGPVLVAYDGSDLAAFAIERAGLELAPGRDALVVVVWHPADVGFVPVDGRHLRADAADEVQEAAERTAAAGASLAEAAGFRSRGLAVEATPTWQGIVAAADEHGASLIVFGSHRRTGLKGHLVGSVTAATMAHSAAAVLVVLPPA